MEKPNREGAPSELPQIAKEIERMADEDQNMREKSNEEGWDIKIDRRNTEAMKGIVAQIGWPTISKVGEKVSKLAWLLVQHADHDLKFQQACLSLMREQPAGEVSARDIAYLEDRVRVNAGREQLYGTQFRTELDKEGQVTFFGPQPIEDEEHVDERRAEVGLDSMEEYRKEITQRNQKLFMRKS